MDKNPAEIRQLRIKTGLTQKELAEFFGMSLSSWQRKESVTGRVVPITNAEYFSLLLLAGDHPDFVLEKRNKDDAS